MLWKPGKAPAGWVTRQIADLTSKNVGSTRSRYNDVPALNRVKITVQTSKLFFNSSEIQFSVTSSSSNRFFPYIFAEVHGFKFDTIVDGSAHIRYTPQKKRALLK